MRRLQRRPWGIALFWEAQVSALSEWVPIHSHRPFFHNYRKIPRIRPPFDAKKFMPKKGGGLIQEDRAFDIIDQQYYKKL